MKDFYIIAWFWLPEDLHYYAVPARSLDHALERFNDYQAGVNAGAKTKSEWNIEEISLKRRRGFEYHKIL